MKTCSPLAVAVLSLTALGWSGTHARACSVVMGYTPPTNYELVKEAQGIVLAQAIEFRKTGDLPGQKHSQGTFRFRILERIKGDYPDAFLSAEGDDDLESWGDPEDFGFTKPDRGMCNSTDYRLDGHYVLFLEQWKGRWFVGGPPFTRINVLVPETNAPWAQAVRHYARIAALKTEAKEKLALRDLRTRASTNAPGCPKALAKDIDAHFQTPTRAKSFADLRTLYERTNDPEQRRSVLWACALGKKPEARELFVPLLRSGEWLRYIGPVCRSVAEISLTGFHEKFASALATNQVSYERRMLLVALKSCAPSSERALMLKVLKSIDNEEVVLLEDWLIQHPSPGAIQHLTDLTRGRYAEEAGLTLILAGMGDTNVLNWAETFARRPGEEAWVGNYVIARSPLSVAGPLARSVIDRGDSPALVWLIQAYQDSRRADRLDRVRDALAIKNKSRELLYWLRRTLEHWGDGGDTAAAQLLGQLPVVEIE